jgi:hypothetical protein
MKKLALLGLSLALSMVSCSNQSGSTAKAATGSHSGRYFLAWGASHPARSCLNEYTDSSYQVLKKFWGCVEHRDPDYIAWAKGHRSLARVIAAFGFFELDNIPLAVTARIGWPEFLDLMQRNASFEDTPFAVVAKYCECVEANNHHMLTLTAEFSNGQQTKQILRDFKSTDLCEANLEQLSICEE